MFALRSVLPAALRQAGRCLDGPAIRRRPRVSVALLALALVLGIARPAAAQPTIMAIDIDGNSSTESSLIRSRFPLAVGDRLNPALAREGLKALYGLGLFSDVKLLAEANGELGVNLLIRVVERQRIDSLHFDGNDAVDDDELEDRLVLTAGELLDPAAVEAARQEILAAYREEGFPLATVSVEREIVEATGRVKLTFDVTEGERLRIRRIAFVGNDGLEDDDLRGAMESKTKGFLRSGKFEQEKLLADLDRIETFYHDNGYRDAKVLGYDVKYPGSPRDMFVEIEVAEGPRYEMAAPTWHGNESVGDELIAQLVPWSPGDPYSASKLARFSGAIGEAFTERGYLLGFSVDRQETVLPNNQVQAHYAISEGEPSRIGEIRILGNTRTKEHVIRRELEIYPGEIFRRSRLMRSQREVFALGYFDDVQVDFGKTDPETNDIDLEIEVIERRLGTAGAGMGFSSATGLTGFLQIGHNNLFGNGWAMNMHLERGSRRSQYELSFTEPWLLDRPISLGVDLFDTEIERDVYDDRRRGAGITIGWPMPGIDYTRASASFQVQDIEIPYISPSLSEDTQRRLRDGEGTIVSTTWGLRRSTTDNPFYPTSGSRSSYTVELAGGILGGTVDFHKHTIDHRTYVRPFWKPVLMLRARIGALLPYVTGGMVPGYETFRLGGTLQNYLRGYDDYDVVPEDNIVGSSRFPGGRYMTTFTTEYQFPIAHPLHGLLFLDMGDTWNEIDDFSLNSLKRGAGIGFRMEVPMLGLLGLDYAYGFDREGGAKWKPHLIIGRQF